MTGLRGLLRRGLDRVRRSDAGTATVEFVIVFPVFIAVFVMGIETAILMTRNVLLERAVDMAVRDLRLGTWPTVTADILEDAICARAASIPDCKSVLLLELTSVPKPAWTTPSPTATCVDRGEAEKPVVTFRDGPENEFMIVRACVVVDPFFPGTELALRLMQQTDGQGYALVSTSGYVNEPREGT